MSADWLRVANNPLQLFNHRLGDADIIEVNLKAESPGRVGNLPPLLERHAVAQRFNHPTNGGDGSLALVDPKRITDSLALFRL